MNKKMKKAIQSIQTTLAMLAVACASLVSLTACSDDDEPVAEVTYSWGFADMSASSPDFMDDIHKISSTFAVALGAPASASEVTRQGTPEQCDKAVLEACQQALESLKDEAWQGHYTFTVTNVTTGTVIFSHTFDADNENSGKSYTASSLKPGDYIYDDGTTSDGGLRGIKGDGTIEWAEPKPQPESGKTVVGVVFWTPSETTKEGRKTPARLSDNRIMTAEHPNCTHGLAVSVKKVTYNGSEKMAWQSSYEFVKDWQTENGFINKYNFVSVASGTHFLDNINWINGYQNTVVLRAYNAYCKANDRPKYIVQPVVAIDEFAKNNPAPAGSTGWFFPSMKEMHMLCYKDVDDVYRQKDPSHTTTRDIVNSSLTAAGGDALETSPYAPYWTASEDTEFNFFAYDIFLDEAFVSAISKNLNNRRVRAVCAF